MASGNVAFLLGFGVETVVLLVSTSLASVEYDSAGDYVVNVVSCHIFSLVSEEEFICVCGDVLPSQNFFYVMCVFCICFCVRVCRPI